MYYYEIALWDTMYRYRLYGHYLSIHSIFISVNTLRAINHWCIRITCLRSCMSYQVDNRRRRVDEEFKKAMTESDAPSRNAMLEGNHKIFSNYALCKSNNYYQTCLCKNTLPLMGFPSPNLKMLNQNLHSFFIGCPSVKSSQMAKNRLGFASPSLGTLQFG